MIGAGMPIGLANPWMLLSLAIPVIIALVWHQPRRGIVLRLLAVTAAIIATAGPEWHVSQMTSDAVILIDRSASVTALSTPADVTEWVDAVRSTHPDANWGGVAFGAEADIIALPDQPWMSAIAAGASPIGEATDLRAGVEAAVSLIAGGSGGEIILLSDGAITSGLFEGIAMAREAGVPISTLAMPVIEGMDAAMMRLDLPETVDVGRGFLVTASIDSNTEADAVITFYRDGDLLDSRDVTLFAGRTDVSIVSELSVPGMATYRVIVKADGDRVAGNDALSAMVRTNERPSLLLIHSEPVDILEALLQASGRSYVHADHVPDTVQLAGYHQVILSGMPLAALSSSDVARLEAYVRDVGGALLVVQGPSELSGIPPGELERLLPVSYSVPEQAQEADLLVIFVLDRSGSMRNFAAGGMKIDLLKQATVAAVNLLPDEALIGVVGFDVAYDWIVPLQRVENRDAFFSGLQSMQAGGGTDLFYPLSSALMQAAAADARVRHVLLFTDGRTVEGIHDYDELIDQIASQEDVKVSVVAIGSNPNREFLARFVEAGDGELYEATDYGELPEISMRAIRRFSQSRFVLDTGAVSGTMAVGDLHSIPSIGGHSVTYEKPSSEVLLWADTGTRKDPLFIRWRNGRGNVAVLNTDLQGQWSADWVAWEKAALLVDSLLAAIPGMPTATGVSVEVAVSSTDLTVWVDARDEANAYANFLDLEARLLPGLGAIDLVQVAPGLYEGVFAAPGEGAYAIQLVDRTRQLLHTQAFAIPYSDEYGLGGSDRDLLQRIAFETGGRYLGVPSDLVLSSSTERMRAIELYPYVLLGSVMLLLLDLVARKLPALRRRR
ncbi:VWA domain-containing protein [Candidatus Bipolaricaulota bacterium]|nr:VWA domain-containing protein [Candidatus Bipolaricaulota bacterium]